MRLFNNSEKQSFSYPTVIEARKGSGNNYFFIGVIVLVIGITLVFVGSKLLNSQPGQLSLEEKVELVNKQFAEGTITREGANEQFCVLKARPKNQQQKAIEAIRTYTNKPDLKVEYKCNNFSPNSPSLEPTEETYYAENNFYFVNIATNKVERVQSN